MNRLGKNALLMVALLLAAAVDYFDDPVLSDAQRNTEAARTLTAVDEPTDVSATSTPSTATSTPVVQVMAFGGIGQARPFPDDEVYKVNISGSSASIKLRGPDEDGNLDYLATVDEDDEDQGRSDCDATMGSECTLEVTIPSPAEYDRAFTYQGIAVESEGVVSKKSGRIDVTSVWDKGSSAGSSSSRRRPPSPVRPPSPSPTPVNSMTVLAGNQAVVEHGSGAKIEIPADATNSIPSDWSAGPELSTTTPTALDEMVTVSITEGEPPSPSVVEMQSAYDISVSLSSSGPYQCWSQVVSGGTRNWGRVQRCAFPAVDFARAKPHTSMTEWRVRWGGSGQAKYGSQFRGWEETGVFQFRSRPCRACAKSLSKWIESHSSHGRGQIASENLSLWRLKGLSVPCSHRGLGGRRSDPSCHWWSISQSCTVHWGHCQRWKEKVR